MSEMVLTKNFYNFIRTAILSTNSNNGVVITSGDGFVNNASSPTQLATVLIDEIININGNTASLNGCIAGALSGGDGVRGAQISLLKFTNANSEDTFNTFFGVGSGNTPATSTDYNLISKITDCVISLSATHYLTTDNVGVCEFNIAVKATGDITIKEIGMFKNIMGKFQYTTGESTDKCLLGRCVLSEPVSLSANQTTTFKVRISF